MSEKKFEQWCLVELMGHQKIAGLCTERIIAGANFLQVDVPATTTEPAFTRLYSPAAVYCIHPIDELTATTIAANIKQRPIQPWDLQKLIEKLPMKLVASKDDINEMLESQRIDTEGF